MNPSRAVRFLVMVALLFGVPFRASAVVHPPDVNPADFTNPPRKIDNWYFPLPVGTLFVYEGTKDGIPTRDEICVTRQTKLIKGVGVMARVVHHQSFENGTPVEDTQDWFAQDRFGNIWFGEDTIDVQSGSKEGSWEAGVNDADAGFIMLANPAGRRSLLPRVCPQYYREFARNVAEDQAKVLSLNETVTVNGKIYQDVLLTQETTRFDPGVCSADCCSRPGVT